MAADPLVCYTISQNYVTSSNQYFPCGNPSSAGGQSCCSAGDYCMQDNICQYTHSVVNGTGYYMAGCTDPTWSDPGCPQQCTSEFGADVVYDTTNEHWDCCASTADSLNCMQPSNIIVNAPHPAQLILIQNLSIPIPSPALTTGVGAISTTVSITPSTSSSSSTSQGSLSATPSQSSSTATSAPSPSGGELAGIAISVILAVALLGLLGLIALRRHRRTQLPPSLTIKHAYDDLNRSVLPLPSPGSESHVSSASYSDHPSPGLYTHSLHSDHSLHQQQQHTASVAFTHSPLIPHHFTGPPPSIPSSTELPMSPRDEQVARQQSPHTRFNGTAVELEGDLGRHGELPGSFPGRRVFSFELPPNSRLRDARFSRARRSRAHGLGLELREEHDGGE